MRDYSTLIALTEEVGRRLYVATTLNTADESIKNRYFAFLEVAEKIEAADNALQIKLVESGVSIPNFDVQLRAMRANIEVFRAENLPLQTEIQKLTNEYDTLRGAQSIEWDGETLTLEQVIAKLNEPDRALRERAWHAAYARQLQDREAFNALWQKLYTLRSRIANNAGKANYRDYHWVGAHRFDYTPEQNLQFLAAIKQVVVPAMQRLLQRRKQLLGLDTLRPWDMAVDPTGEPALKPFSNISQLIDGAANIFAQINPELSAYYNTMRDKHLLDLDNRPNKAPGGYCIDYPTSQEVFIFMNSVGTHDNVQTLLHEAGHAFHAYEAYAQPYMHQQDYPIEFAEVASMSMELLAAPYLDESRGGFYDTHNAARARIEHLEGMIYFWCYMAVVDGFQHWAYTHPAQATDPAACDAQWLSLWQEYLPDVDWSGLEEYQKTGWHRKLHIFQIPFYYVEYGLAQLGAAQVWRNSLTDYEKALNDYRYGLSLGGTRTLTQLFEAVGAKLAFDADTLGELVALIEQTINELSAH